MYAQQKTILETPRLWLCEWEPEDWLAFRRLATDPRVMRYISEGKPWDDGRIRSFVARQIAGQRERGFCLWKLVWKETGELAGMCGLQPLEGTQEIEIGWWLIPELWGRGAASEAARAALAWAFETTGLRRIVSVALPENQASIRIMEKLGMTFEGRVRHKGFEVVKYAAEEKYSAGL